MHILLAWLCLNHRDLVGTATSAGSLQFGPTSLQSLAKHKLNILQQKIVQRKKDNFLLTLEVFVIWLSEYLSLYIQQVSLAETWPHLQGL